MREQCPVTSVWRGGVRHSSILQRAHTEGDVKPGPRPLMHPEPFSRRPVSTVAVGKGSLALPACGEAAVLINFICIISSINSTWREEKR